MSDNTPNKYGGHKGQPNTAQCEIRVQNSDAGLAHDSDKFMVIGNANPGSFNPNPNMSSVESKQGVTAVTHAMFMSERDTGFQIALNEATARAKQLAICSDIPPVWNLATTGFTQGTIGAGSTRNVLTISGAQAALLTTDHLLYVKYDAGELTQAEEEVYVKNVTGDQVTLRNKLSRTPAEGTVVDRIHRIDIREGGTSYENLHFNLKNTLNDKSVQIMDYPECRMMNGNRKSGSNSEIQGVELTAKAIPSPVVINGAEEPIFSTEYIYPRTEAALLT